MYTSNKLIDSKITNKSQERLTRLNKSKIQRSLPKSGESSYFNSSASFRQGKSIFASSLQIQNNQLPRLSKLNIETKIEETDKKQFESPKIQISLSTSQKFLLIQKEKELMLMHNEHTPTSQFVRSINEQLSNKFLSLSPYKIDDTPSFSAVIQETQIPDSNTQEIERNQKMTRTLSIPRFYNFGLKPSKKEFLPLLSKSIICKSQELIGMINPEKSPEEIDVSIMNSLPKIRKHIMKISAQSSFPIKDLPLIKEFPKRLQGSVLGIRNRILNDEMINRVYENPLPLTLAKKMMKSFRVKSMKYPLNKNSMENIGILSNRSSDSLIKTKDSLDFITTSALKYDIINENGNEEDDFYVVNKDQVNGKRKKRKKRVILSQKIQDIYKKNIIE